MHIIVFVLINIRLYFDGISGIGKCILKTLYIYFQKKNLYMNFLKHKIYTKCMDKFPKGKFLSGSYSREVTPVPIPNTVVKFSSADGSGGLAFARVGRRQAYQKLNHDIVI